MSETETRQGFEIRRKFYPLVTVADWLNGDFILARMMTKLSPPEIFSGQADYLSVQMALVAVAVSHERPELDEGQIIRFVKALKPDQITEVGFASVDDDEDDDESGEGDERPPVEGRVQESGSAESSDTASETENAPTPTATGEPSGEPGSPTGSPE